MIEIRTVIAQGLDRHFLGEVKMLLYLNRIVVMSLCIFKIYQTFQGPLEKKLKITAKPAPLDTISLKNILINCLFAKNIILPEEREYQI